MFSDNHKISARQLQALFITDWLGKAVLLIPKLAQGNGSRSALLAAFAGILLAGGALAGILGAVGQISGNYYSHAKKYAGTIAAVFLYLVYELYFLLHTVVMLYLCGEIAAAYLLPDISPVVLTLLPAFVGYYLAGGGVEVKARVSEMSAWLISLVLFLMLFLSVFQIRRGQLWQPEKLEPALLLENSYLTAAGFGGICALPLVLPEVEKTGGWKKRVYASLGISGIFLLLTYFIGFGIFGEKGMGRLHWPVISLMSSVNLPGMFLQRWDIPLTGLLMISLFLSAGSGIFYMENILMTLKYGEDFQNQNVRISGSWRKRLLHRKRRKIRIIALAAVYFLILQMRNLETAVRWYEEIGLLFCVPVMTGMILFIWWRKHSTEKKNRREMHGAE